MAYEDFNPTASPSGDTWNPDSEGPGGVSSIEKAAKARTDQANAQHASALGTGAGIIGSIISTFASGNPLTGYAIGKDLGGAVANRSAPTLPGIDQLQAVLNAPKAKPTADEGEAATEVGPAEGFSDAY